MVAHLLKDVGIPSVVEVKRLAAVGAFDFVHGIDFIKDGATSYTSKI